MRKVNYHCENAVTLDFRSISVVIGKYSETYESQIDIKNIYKQRRKNKIKGKN